MEGMEMRMLEGANCLPVTPFTESGEFDEASMRRLVDHVIEGGVASVIAMGRVGEVMYLTMEERARVMEVVMDQVAGRVPVGFGSIELGYEEGLAIGRLARDAGADFVMSQGPSDGDVMEYYRRLADIIPVVVYDLGKQRELSVREDIVPLAEETGNVAGMKISGAQEKVAEAKMLLDVPVLCGHDVMGLVGYQMGADGVTSGSAMMLPREQVELHRLVAAGQWNEARTLFYGTLLPIMNYLPGGPGMMGWSVCKNILKWEGIIECAAVRPPSLPAGPARLDEARHVWEMVKG
jgi:4-hydroxy-tetrahydrodipicolinate synthase